MTDNEQAIIDSITNEVLTRLNRNSIDWSANPITFADKFDIQINERNNIKIPAIDKRNGIVYGSLDLNSLLAVYGTSRAVKSADRAQEIVDVAKDGIIDVANEKMSELNEIVGQGVVEIRQTEQSEDDRGLNKIEFTLTNGTTRLFSIRNGSQGPKGDKMTYADLTDSDKADIRSSLSSVNNQYINEVSIQTSTTRIPIGISQYNNETDILEVFGNGMWMTEGVEFTSDGSYITLNSPASAGSKIAIVVTKSLALNKADWDSLQPDELEPITNLEIDAFFKEI